MNDRERALLDAAREVVEVTSVIRAGWRGSKVADAAEALSKACDAYDAGEELRAGHTPEPPS